MSTDLRTELKRVEGQLSELRDERAREGQDAQRRAREVPEAPRGRAQQPRQREFKAVEKMVGEVGSLDDKITDIQRVQVGLLKALGEDDGKPDAGRGPRSASSPRTGSTRSCARR
jgi:hypothetical protein